LLVRDLNGEILSGIIVETEAYLAEGDEAAHGFNGQTKRNASLYKKGGHAYVHTMRQYVLLDVVTGNKGTSGSVLIRALEPVTGIEKMMHLRHEDRLSKLTNGPGKVGAALHITRTLDGIDMTKRKSGLYIAERKNGPVHPIAVSPRIGISKAMEMPLRFYHAENPHVSKKR
jgi:DNA-3-methyladenine glycosylase